LPTLGPQHGTADDPPGAQLGQGLVDGVERARMDRHRRHAAGLGQRDQLSQLGQAAVIGSADI
jgi:hypothetical protein